MEKFWATWAKCTICGIRREGRFEGHSFICDKHSSDECDFFQSLQEGTLSKEQKSQRRIYEQQWK